jgi:hypothetical protein
VFTDSSVLVFFSPFIFLPVDSRVWIDNRSNRARICFALFSDAVSFRGLGSSQLHHPYSFFDLTPTILSIVTILNCISEHQIPVSRIGIAIRIRAINLFWANPIGPNLLIFSISQSVPRRLEAIVGNHYIWRWISKGRRIYLDSLFLVLSNVSIHRSADSDFDDSHHLFVVSTNRQGQVSDNNTIQVYIYTILVACLLGEIWPLGIMCLTLF